MFNYKKIVTSLVAIIICFFIIDSLVGYIGKSIVEKLNEKNYSGQAALLNYNLNKVTADIVVLGGSTASCHIIPRLLADSINTYLGKNYSAFNTGAYFQQPTYSYCVLKSMIERNPPKIAIVDIQPQQLGGPTVRSALKPLRPYYGVNENVKEILDRNESWTDRVLLKLNMFQFNTEFLKLLMSFLKPIGADGYDPREGHTYTVDNSTVKDTSLLNETVVSEFESMIKLAKNNKVKLFIYLSPRLFYTDYESRSYKKIVSLCKLYQVPLFDFTKDQKMKNGVFFHDKTHLNHEGATKLTTMICDSIKKYIE